MKYDSSKYTDAESIAVNSAQNIQQETSVTEGIILFVFLVIFFWWIA